MTTPGEEAAIFSKVLNNSVTICSWSPFNQYWILQALGNLNRMEHATASIRLCWGPMLTLGKGCFCEEHMYSNGLSPRDSRLTQTGAANRGALLA